MPMDGGLFAAGAERKNELIAFIVVGVVLTAVTCVIQSAYEAR